MLKTQFAIFIFANLQLIFYNMQFKKVENIDDLQGRATLYTFNIIQFTDFSEIKCTTNPWYLICLEIVNYLRNNIINFLSKYMHVLILKQRSINDRKYKICQRLY